MSQNRAWGWVCLLLGILLLALSLFDYRQQLASQVIEQRRRDGHWLKVQQEAAQRFPHVLPGEAKPEPAALHDWPRIGTLAICGVAVLLIGGALVALSRPRSL